MVRILTCKQSVRHPCCTWDLLVFPILRSSQEWISDGPLWSQELFSEGHTSVIFVSIGIIDWSCISCSLSANLWLSMAWQGVCRLLSIIVIIISQTKHYLHKHWTNLRIVCLSYRTPNQSQPTAFKRTSRYDLKPLVFNDAPCPSQWIQLFFLRHWDPCSTMAQIQPFWYDKTSFCFPGDLTYCPLWINHHNLGWCSLFCPRD